MTGRHSGIRAELLPGIISDDLAEHHEIIAIDDQGVAWPTLAHRLGVAVATGRADAGIVMCWTGTGTAIAANKVHGVRAAQASDAWIARGARLWNDANVLALSLKRLAPDVAVECVRAFLDVATIDADEADAIDVLKSLDG